jgi:hypothetical protein
LIWPVSSAVRQGMVDSILFAWMPNILGVGGADVSTLDGGNWSWIMYERVSW